MSSNGQLVSVLLNAPHPTVEGVRQVAAQYREWCLAWQAGEAVCPPGYQGWKKRLLSGEGFVPPHFDSLRAMMEKVGKSEPPQVEDELTTVAAGLAFIRKVIAWCDDQGEPKITKDADADGDRERTRKPQEVGVVTPPTDSEVDCLLSPTQRGIVKEVGQAAESLREIIGSWEFWLIEYGNRLAVLPDYGKDLTTPPETIDGFAEAIFFEQNALIALRILYNHRCLPSSLKNQTLEETLQLFPQYPRGPISSEKDKAFVVAVRQAMPALRDLAMELGRFLDQLSGAPFSIIRDSEKLEPPAPRPPEATIIKENNTDEGDKLTDSIFPALLSVSDIANRINRNRKSVTSFLTRFANKKPDCRIENTSKRRNEPTYLYRTEDVWPALEKWMKDGAAD